MAKRFFFSFSFDNAVILLKMTVTNFHIPPRFCLLIQCLHTRFPPKKQQTYQ